MIALGATILSCGLTSCLEEAFPQDGTYTEGQLKDASMEAVSLACLHI